MRWVFWVCVWLGLIINAVLLGWAVADLVNAPSDWVFVRVCVLGFTVGVFSVGIFIATKLLSTGK